MLVSRHYFSVVISDVWTVDSDDGLQMSISKKFYRDDLPGDDQLMYTTVSAARETRPNFRGEKFNSL